MSRWEAPGKLNLSLLVHPPGPDGYHPVESVVQTIGWLDQVTVEDGEEGGDVLVTDVSDLDVGNNLVLRALAAVRATGAALPPQRVTLEKNLPVAAGLGGGSSDAAATVMAVAGRLGLGEADLSAICAGLGADVPLFLAGGTQLMAGIGDRLEPLAPLTGFWVAVVVPPFGLDTAEVYRAWDRLGGPIGEVIAERAVPPQLRGGMPLRNDLLPAAIHLQPGLADFIAEVRALWGVSVAMTGSGSGCFGYFATVDEATEAVAAVSHICRQSRAADLRPRGVAPAPADQGEDSDAG